MNILKWFSKQPKYEGQALTDKQKDLIAQIDNKLVELHKDTKVGGDMFVTMTTIPFMSTILPVDNLIPRILLEQGKGYVPRSVAFIVNPAGDWVLLYAIRKDVEQGTSIVCNTMFLNLLGRTNDAR